MILTHTSLLNYIQHAPMLPFIPLPANLADPIQEESSFR